MPDKHIEKREWAATIKVGDIVSPDPMWNATTGNKVSHLSPNTRVIAIKRASCQTSFMFLVRFISDKKCWLDAGWFSPYIEESKPINLMNIE